MDVLQPDAAHLETKKPLFLAWKEAGNSTQRVWGSSKISSLRPAQLPQPVTQALDAAAPLRGKRGAAEGEARIGLWFPCELGASSCYDCCPLLSSTPRMKALSLRPKAAAKKFPRREAPAVPVDVEAPPGATSVEGLLPT